MSVKSMSHDGPCRKTLYEYQRAQDRQLYGKTRHGASCDMAPVKPQLNGVPRCLIPFDRREGLSLAQAARIAGKSVDTVRLWCLNHDIGRRVGGGSWVVSRVALTMFLDDDRRALEAYLAGSRSERDVAPYFHRLGLDGLLREWARSA